LLDVAPGPGERLKGKVSAMTTPKKPAVAMKPADWKKNLPRPAWKNLKRISEENSWFCVYELDYRTYAIYEDGQYEESISYLLLGEDRAMLVDTGNGIANLRAQCRKLTSLPILLVNTHSHIDHVGSNYMFDEIAAFDDHMGLARRTAALGYHHEKARTYIEGSAVWKPFPKEFDPSAFCIPPYRITRWLQDGEVLDLGGRQIEVLYTPGHSPDSICLLDRSARMLWVGDLFYTGSIYTWLAGGDIDLLIESFEHLIGLFQHYDLLMPSHNEAAIEKEILLEALEGARQVRDGKGDYILLEGGRRKYPFSRFAFVTGPDGR
jgi:glyoxylase-like metal-dependent hydrolase (beta-lactamase superfamily II)